MNDNNELENLDGGLPHCSKNPADKLDSKMTEQEQFILYCKNECDPDSGGFANEKLCLKCKIKYLESKLLTLRGDITAEAIMLIKEYALCPDKKLTGNAKKLKRRIIEAMGVIEGDKLSKVREWVDNYDSIVEGFFAGGLSGLKQILEGK